MSEVIPQTGRRLKNGSKLQLPERLDSRDYWGYNLLGYFSLLLEINGVKKAMGRNGSYTRKLIVPATDLKPAVMVAHECEKMPEGKWYRKDEFGLSALKRVSDERYDVSLLPTLDFEEPVSWMSIADVNVTGHGVTGAFPKPSVSFQDKPVQWPGQMSFNDRVSEILDQFQDLVS